MGPAVAVAAAVPIMGAANIAALAGIAAFLKMKRQRENHPNIEDIEEF